MPPIYEMASSLVSPAGSIGTFSAGVLARTLDTESTEFIIPKNSWLSVSGRPPTV